MGVRARAAAGAARGVRAPRGRPAQHPAGSSCALRRRPVDQQSSPAVLSPQRGQLMRFAGPEGLSGGLAAERGEAGGARRAGRWRTARRRWVTWTATPPSRRARLARRCRPRARCAARSTAWSPARCARSARPRPGDAHSSERMRRSVSRTYNRTEVLPAFMRSAYEEAAAGQRLPGSAHLTVATSAAPNAAHHGVCTHTTRCMSQDPRLVSRPARLHRPWRRCFRCPAALQSVDCGRARGRARARRATRSARCGRRGTTRARSAS